MLDLPILNVRLSPCPHPLPPLSPTPQGHHCSSCNRAVIDFTQATQADLDAARAASPDGQLCGRFWPKQLAPPQPRLRPKLRRFLLALVCGLGLTGEQAWAQVQFGVKDAEPQPALQLKRPEELNPLRLTNATKEQLFVHRSFGQAPVFKGGQELMLKLIKQNQRWPGEASSVEGKIFVKFVVDTRGQVLRGSVIKGIHPALDKEALRLVQLLNGHFTPGILNGQPVDAWYTVVIPFIKQRKFTSPRVICILEPMPSFPGGHDSLVAYLKRNLRYPTSIEAEGKVSIGFIITKTGQVTQAEVLKGINPVYDAEALRVVRQMPRWVQPRRPQPIEVRYTLPITFRLN